MYKVLISMVTSALASASPGLIQKVAASLSKYIGKPIAASADACIAAIKAFTRGNSTTMLVIANILASVGVDLALDKIQEAAQGNPTYEHLAMEVGSAIQKFTEERRSLTGDAKPDTVHGLPTTQLAGSVQLLVATNSIIDNAQRLVGGVNALKTLRAAIFLEEADYDNYVALS